MPRARNIKPGFYRDAALVELPIETRLLFPGLWMLADRLGRLEDRPKQIKMDIYPADSFDVDVLLSQLYKAGLIIRYEVNGERYIQIKNFGKHQNPHKDEKASILPPPCEHGANTVQAPCETGANPADSCFSDSCFSETTTLALCAAPKRGLNGRPPAGFDAFYAAYPRKKSKNTAIRAWQKISPKEQLRSAIMAGLERAKTSADWRRDGGKFIPYPASWLNAGGWQDDTAPVLIAVPMRGIL